MRSLENWQRCQEIYDLWQLDFIAHKPGMYLWIHTETKKLVWGDPTKDVANGGQLDACNWFKRLHGFEHGKFFGIRIPTEFPEISRCDWIQGRFDIVGVDEFTIDPGLVSHECLRPGGHDGSHLIKQLDQVGGRYVIWQHDLCDFGICPDCDGEDPVDNCLAYDYVSDDRASKLMKSRTYK
jgi:hypothetical protein